MGFGIWRQTEIHQINIQEESFLCQSGRQESGKTEEIGGLRIPKTIPSGKSSRKSFMVCAQYGIRCIFCYLCLLGLVMVRIVGVENNQKVTGRF